MKRMTNRYTIRQHLSAKLRCAHASAQGCSPKKEVCGRHKKLVDARLSQCHKHRLHKTYITDRFIQRSMDAVDLRPCPTTPLSRRRRRSIIVLQSNCALRTCPRSLHSNCLG